MLGIGHEPAPVPGTDVIRDLSLGLADPHPGVGGHQCERATDSGPIMPHPEWKGSTSRTADRNGSERREYCPMPHRETIRPVLSNGLQSLATPS